MNRWTSTLVAALAALVAAAPAGAQTVLPPSVSADTLFSPPTGINDFDFTPGTSVDATGGVVVSGARIYTVGETRLNASDPTIGITARRLDGTLDPGFSEDGKLTINIAAGTQRDAGFSAAVLPDGRLRIVGTTDVDAGTQSSQVNLDVLVVGLMPDGSFDTSFGAPDGDSGARKGWITFPAGAANDVPSRMDIAQDGRIALTGCTIATASGTSCSSAQDFFVSVRNADGSPAAFGVGGVKTFNRGGSLPKPSTTPEQLVPMVDRGVDVAFRPGGGIVVLIQVETNPADNDNDWHSVLHAFGDDGSDLTAFSEDGDLDLPIGDPDIIPGGLMVHDGRLWVTGAVRSGDNGEAYLARLNPDGSDLQFRSFDIRAAVPAELPVGSQGNDLAVVPGTPDTLIVGGFTTLQEGTSWAAVVFHDFLGDLTAARSGETIFELPRNASGIEQQGTLTSLAPSPEGWVAAGGSLLDLNSADTSFGTARLLIDADKRCDLNLEVTRPLEIAFDGQSPTTVDLRVTNAGTKGCGGSVDVDGDYALRSAGADAPLQTGFLAPGTSVTFAGAELAMTGAAKRSDVVSFKLTSAADANQANNTRNVRAIFRFCNLRLTPVGAAGLMPAEGSRGFEFTLRNLGTTTCRGVAVGVAGDARRTSRPDPFTLRPGRSASEVVRAKLSAGGLAQATIEFTAGATPDSDLARDSVRLELPVTPVGDSSIRSAGRRAISGRASGAKGTLPKRQRRVRRVQVAVFRKSGKKCLWAKRGGKLRKRSCSRPVWVGARGKRAWRVTFKRALPAGAYTARSRAVIGAGFREGSFSASDGNLRAFHVR